MSRDFTMDLFHSNFKALNLVRKKHFGIFGMLD